MVVQPGHAALKSMAGTQPASGGTCASERWRAAHREGMPQASYPRVPSLLVGKYASPPQIRSF